MSTEVIVVTSGKGGVGKTTTSANIGAALALEGKKVCVVDFDVGLRNLDLMFGAERRVVYDFIHVVEGVARLNQAILKEKRNPNLYLLPTSQTKDKSALAMDKVSKVMDELINGFSSEDVPDGFDYIICDSPAGIEEGAKTALYFADQAIVVTNPEVSSVTDADRIVGMLQSQTRRAEEGRRAVNTQLLVTRYCPERVEAGGMISLEQIDDTLKLPLIGVIPESMDVLESSNHGTPVVFKEGSLSGEAYKDLARRILGEDVPMRFTAVKKKGFWKRFKDGRAA